MTSQTIMNYETSPKCVVGLQCSFFIDLSSLLSLSSLLFIITFITIIQTPIISNLFIFVSHIIFNLPYIFFPTSIRKLFLIILQDVFEIEITFTTLEY